MSLSEYLGQLANEKKCKQLDIFSALMSMGTLGSELFDVFARCNLSSDERHAMFLKMSRCADATKEQRAFIAALGHLLSSEHYLAQKVVLKTKAIETKGLGLELATVGANRARFERDMEVYRTALTPNGLPANYAGVDFGKFKGKWLIYMNSSFAEISVENILVFPGAGQPLHLNACFVQIAADGLSGVALTAFSTAFSFPAPSSSVQSTSAGSAAAAVDVKSKK